MKTYRAPAPIADKTQFEATLSQFSWIFEIIGTQESVQKDRFKSFVTKAYDNYDANHEQLRIDLKSYGRLLTEKELRSTLAEINREMEVARLGMKLRNELKNEVKEKLPKRAWSICINKVVVPKLFTKHYPNNGIAFLFHSLISRFNHWNDFQQTKKDYEKFHPGIFIEDLIIEKKYAKWQMKELDKVQARNKKRHEERLRNEERVMEINAEHLKKQLPLLPSKEEQERLKEQAHMDKIVLYELDYLAMYGRNPESFDSGFYCTKTTTF